ncbi:hypothetical protein Pla108_29480 [Botrimarina colliarenosi]|uniref:DUF4114 domain-containing protein n=1 Tax=Botrimarina colliarenosi TaxID=2528001 RepID=A0A5C6AA07_9BACT|nr:DUF4114 domain-containing protein [Botrimarina colliarenosi]TWT95871.1 hypothetical protein Pla108_29480 [Botrimarina colliarenosi]
MSVQSLVRPVMGAILLVGLAMPATATDRNPQSTFTVFGMPITAKTQVTGSDSRSAAFNNEILPGARALVAANLREGVEFLAAGVTRLDEDRLYLLNDSDRPVRVYYVAEGAGYRNTLGFSTAMAGSLVNGQRKIIFPDVSDGTIGGPRMLDPGDWVELGDYPRGTSFEFFIVRDAVNGGRDIFTNRDASNPDGLQHLAAWLLGDRYVLLGFEDLMNGGDLDYNDVVFVVDLSPDLGQGPLAILPR